MLLYIIRHGDPIYSPDSLTELGHRQAEALSKRLSVHGLDRIYSSPNIRAIQTAEPIARELGLEIQIEPWTSEDLTWEEFSNGERWSYNDDGTMMKSDELQALGDKWYTSPAFANAAAPESGYRRICAESDDFLKRLGYDREGRIYRVVSHTDERIAVFCHQGFGITWMSHLLAINPCLFWSSFDISHSSITILNFEDHGTGFTAPKCICMSDLSHIYHAGLPLKFCGDIDI